MANNLVLESKLYNLSTRSSAGTILNGDTNYKSLIQFNIPDMIVRDDEIEYIQFSVPYAVIPNSMYVINANNNLLYVTISGTTTLYSFPFGNYNANTFMSTFLSILGGNWNISLNSYSNVFTITNSVTDFSFLLTSTIDSVMGFSTNLTSTSKSLTLTRTCNFLPLPRVIIRCQELSNSTMVGNISTSDVICSIPNNASSNGQIYYQNQTQSKMLYRGDSLNRFIVSLTDDDNNSINFNGISSFFVFQFDIYRKFTPKLPSFRQIIYNVNNQQTD